MVQVNTDEAEGAQALFCYIADILGTKRTAKEFKPFIDGEANQTTFFKDYKKIIDEAFTLKRVRTAKTKTQIIDYIKKKDDWFTSSLRIAQYTIETIGKVGIKNNFKNKISPIDWQKMIYIHGANKTWGDDDIMGNMAILFKSANEASNKYFGNLNKWSPADIYFASPKGKVKIAELAALKPKERPNFSSLNTQIFTLIESGDLLPLSLKQVKDSVVIKEVNFNRKKEDTLLGKLFCKGVEPYVKMKGKYVYNSKSFKFTQPYSGGRDIYVKFIDGDKKKGTIQFRHTPASNGKPSKGFKIVLKYEKSSALAGQIVGIPLLCKRIKIYDSEFATKLESKFNTTYGKFEADMASYVKHGGGKLYNGNKDQKKRFNDDVGAISSLTIMNPLRELIDGYFKVDEEASKKQDGIKNNVVREIFAYAASRSVNSAPFNIAKD
jgi:hypothetical protein